MCLNNSLNRFWSRLEDFKLSLHTSVLEKGHKTMNAIREKLSMLDTETYYRTADQVEIHHLMLAALSRRVYKDNIETNEVEVLDYNGFVTLLHMIFISMPRRSGKTEAIIQMIAVLLLVIENFKVIAISPSFRAAGDDSGLLDGVKRILKQHFGVFKFEKHNSEVLKIKFSDTDTRTLCSYPGGAADK